LINARFLFRVDGSIPNSVQTPKWHKIEQNIDWVGKPENGIPTFSAFYPGILSTRKISGWEWIAPQS